MKDNFDFKGYLSNNRLLTESKDEEVKEEIKEVAAEYSKKQQSILDSVKGDDVYDAVLDSIDSSETPNLTQLESILDKAGYTQDDIDKILGEVKTEGYGKKMKLSELKAKIREEVLAERSIGEAEEDEVDVDIDADIDMEAPEMDEPAMDGEDPFGGDDESVEGAEQKAYDAIIAAGQAYKALGEEDDNGGLKTMIDQLSYLDRVYNYPPKEDVFNDEA